MEQKVCWSCKISKPFPDQFNAQGKICLECHRDKERDRRAKNPESNRGSASRYRERQKVKTELGKEDGESKLCPKCNSVKMLSEFNSIGTWCKECCTRYQWERQGKHGDRKYESRSFVKDETDRKERSKVKSHRYHVKNRRIIKQKNKDAKRKTAEYINSIKQSATCARCGNSDFRCLVFHHLRDKEFDISVAVQRRISLDVIKKEIEKCEVLCANCHMIEHYPHVS